MNVLKKAKSICIIGHEHLKKMIESRKGAGGGEVGNLFMALILAVIGLALTPTISSSAQAVVDDGNSSGAVSALVAIVPLVYVALILVGTAGYMFVSLKKLSGK